MSRYADIADDLRTRITGGEFPVGSRLPSIPDLEQHYGAAMHTVRKAQEELRTEGVLKIAQGQGAFVVKVPTGERTDVVAELRAIQTSVARVLAALEQQDDQK